MWAGPGPAARQPSGKHCICRGATAQTPHHAPPHKHTNTTGAPSPCAQGYKELYTRKWAYTRELAASIQAGLQKMVEAKEDVNKMKAELAVKNQARPPTGLARHV